jgi:Rrf2 family protein
MKILALSEANILSFHSVALIAAAGEKGISVNRIAELTLCSKHHLAKVMEKLLRSNLVYSTRGPLGGFHLTKPADKIFLLEIFEAINGKIDEVETSNLNKSASKAQISILENICDDLSKRFIDFLKNTKISDLRTKAGYLLQ